MKRLAVLWGEQYLYRPNVFQKILSVSLLPLSWIYCLAAYVRYRRATPVSMGIPVVSVGNLIVGGSGKTPLIIELSKAFSRPAIVLRGYGRKSTGMIVVKNNTVLCDITKSGDEAMQYAMALPDAVVIVSQKREEGILEAKKLGCCMVFLDDGYGKHTIEKLDIVIEAKTPNGFCLPSGAYREKLWKEKKVTRIEEGDAFRRHVIVRNPTAKMVLVTAIAHPQRLDVFLPDVIEKVYFEDHHFFTKQELVEIVERTNATSLLVTSKDLVKMSSFNLNISLLELSLEVSHELITTVKEYVDAA